MCIYIYIYICAAVDDDDVVAGPHRPWYTINSTILCYVSFFLFFLFLVCFL